MKIVSLLPSATEIVCALGLADALEGVTHECDYPPVARSKPVVSHPVVDLGPQAGPADIDRAVSERIASGLSIYRLDEDRIAQIQPDLILTQDLCAVCAVPTGQVDEALARLRCSARVLSLDPVSLEDVLADVLRVGEAVGRSREATRLVAGLRARIESVTHRASSLPRVRTLALEWSDPPYNAGHWVPEMIERAGGEALLAEAGRPSYRLTWEECREAKPDLVVFMPCGYALAEAQAEARTLPDLGASTTFAVDASSFFSRPGPRLVDGLEILAWIQHPDHFPKPPPGRVARVA